MSRRMRRNNRQQSGTAEQKNESIETEQTEIKQVEEPELTEKTENEQVEEPELTEKTENEQAEESEPTELTKNEQVEEPELTEKTEPAIEAADTVETAELAETDEGTDTIEKDASVAQRSSASSLPPKEQGLMNQIMNQVNDLLSEHLEKDAKSVSDKLRQLFQTQKESVQRNGQKLRDDLQERRTQFEHRRKEMGEELKKLLSREIAELEKKQKHRSAEILGVFSAHNFYANGFTPIELRTTLEDLGPTYVKIGQIMSSRVDLLPESYCKELEKLRQNVKPLDPAIARAVIEDETGKPIDEIFSEFRDKPLGSASIGQAHYAVLKDGTRVVVKVQRPLVADMMRKDYVLLRKGAGIINAINEASDNPEEQINLLAVIEEMEKVTEEELDFRVEAENTRFFHDNCIEDESKVSCPRVIDELTTERIFTMTFVDGCSIGKKEELLAQGCDLNELGKAIVENYLHQVLDVGTFHADPHQGNIMVADKIPYWIDFGMVGHISDSDVTIIQNLILTLLNGDLDGLVNAVMSMGAASPKTNRNKLMEDIDPLYEKYMNVTSIDDVDLSMLLEEICDLAARHYITLPGKYTMLVRSIATIEGVIEQLCPELNLFELISGKLMDRAKESFDFKQQLISSGKDVLEIGKKTARLPVLASDMLNNMIRGRMKMNMELTGYEELIDRAEKTILNLVLAIFSCVLFFGSCIMTTADIQPKTSNGVPLFAVVGILFSISLAIFTVRKMIKKK